jgi:Protein of unknown function (DUF2848)
MTLSQTVTPTKIARPGEKTLDLAAIDQLVIAGWTGRDVDALEAHIRELEALGVARPKSVPIFYRNSATLLTTCGSVQVVGGKSSGEVEFVLYAIDDGLWVGIGSDHTDRHAETINVTMSKQMCPKPVGSQLWSYADVRPHWEKLTLRSFVLGEDGNYRLYQEGSVANMRSPEELVRLYTKGGTLAKGTAMFCGTFPAHGGLSYSNSFRMELEDPVLNRKMTHGYTVIRLTDEG